jgi:uncharacterized protein YdcH (DUF465 family)
LKRYKSPGNDQIPKELIQAGGETLWSAIHKLINSIWSKEELPDQWIKSIIVPVHKKGVKQEDALSPLLINFALEYAIRNVHENQVRLKLNGTHQLPVYADDANQLDDNIDTIQENTQTLIDARKEACLKVNTEKVSIFCCLITRMQGKIMT